MRNVVYNYRPAIFIFLNNFFYALCKFGGLEICLLLYVEEGKEAVMEN